MARIRPDWTPEFDTNAGHYSWGIDVVWATPVTISGVWWYQPAGDLTDIAVTVYDQATETVLATGSALAGALNIDTWTLVPLDAPYAASDGVTYTIAAEGQGHHGYGDVELPIVSDDELATIVQTRYQSDGGYPAQEWGSGQHGVDVEYAAGGEPEPVEGAVELAAAGTLAAAARTVALGGGEVEAAGALTAAARTVARAAATMPASATLTASGLTVARGGAAFQAAGSLTASARSVPQAQVSLAAAAALTCSVRRVARAAAQLGASGLLTVTLPGAAVLPGTLTAGGSSPTLTAGGTSPATLTPGGTSPTLTAS
jgi:hypothetical protein